MSRRRLPMLVSLSLSLLVGCGTVGPGGGGPDPLHEQARAALARYDQAVADAGAQQRFVG